MTTKTLLAADPTNLVFEVFMRHLAEVSAKYFADHKYASGHVYDMEVGPKYIRIVQADANGTHRSVHCFIERATGNVLKAAGWKAPAKHSRGNVFDGFNDPKAYGVDVFGANYMR